MQPPYIGWNRHTQRNFKISFFVKILNQIFPNFISSFVWGILGLKGLYIKRYKRKREKEQSQSNWSINENCKNKKGKNFVRFKKKRQMKKPTKITTCIHLGGRFHLCNLHLWIEIRDFEIRIPSLIFYCGAAPYNSVAMLKKDGILIYLPLILSCFCLHWTPGPHIVL